MEVWENPTPVFLAGLLTEVGWVALMAGGGDGEPRGFWWQLAEALWPMEKL